MNYREDVAWLLFQVGTRFPWKEHFSVVEESHFSWIPSNKPNLYLLIQRNVGDMVRLLANIEYSQNTGKAKIWEVWLSAQRIGSEHDKYWEHLPVHWFFNLNDVEGIVSKIQ
jgi:hypothetical protein